MADVFISYASEDRERAVQLADRLREAGFTVWWDRHIRGGTNFATEIEREIHAARSVVVAWSAASYGSEWVRDEASYARDERKLVPLRLDQTMPPMGFRQWQTLDFSTWQGEADATCFAALVEAVHRVLDPATATAAHRESVPTVEQSAAVPVPDAGAAKRRMAWVATGLALAGVAALFAWSRFAAPTLPEITAGAVEIKPFLAKPVDPDRSAKAATYTDAFRTRFSQMGIRTTGSDPSPASRSEFVLVGEIARDGGKDVLTARLDDRVTGATLWSLRQPPTDGAAWESNLAGYALTCALKRRTPARGTQLLSHYLNACASFLNRDFQGFYAAAKAGHAVAPDDPNATAFYAVGTAGIAYIQAVSEAERTRQLQEARRLAEEALRRDPGNADANFAMGFTYEDPQYAEQERWWRKSLAADPASGMVFGRYGTFLATVGRMRESMDMALRAAHDRPSLLASQPARMFAAIGDWRQAQELYDMIRPYEPDAVAHYELQTYTMYGDLDTARQMLNERGELAANGKQCLELLLQAREGRGYDARRFGAACEARGDMVNLYGIVGDVDSAYREVDRLLREPGSWEKPKLFGPEMRAFRRDKRFWPLMARMGFVQYWADTNQWPDFCAEPDSQVDCPAAAHAVLSGVEGAGSTASASNASPAGLAAR